MRRVLPSWLPIWLPIWLTLCLAACRQTNPAFDVPETGSEGVDDSTSESSDGDTGQAMCELPPAGAELAITVPLICAENVNDEHYEQWFTVVEASGSEMNGHFCTPQCTSCESGQGSVVVSPLPVADVVEPMDCVQVVAKRAVMDLQQCDYDVIGIWRNGEPEPVLFASNNPAVDLPLANNTADWATFEPGLMPLESCDCTIYPGSCCDGVSSPPTNFFYVLPPNDTEVMPIGSAPISLGGVDYTFHGVHAFSRGGCDAPKQLGWGLTRP